MYNVIFLSFLTGLTTGGFSCLAIQGGLLASSITSTNAEEHRWKYVGMFLIAKLLAYTILGFILGWVGSTLTLTPKLLGWTQILVGIFMLITAARILDLHPIFRYFVIQPPKWAYRLLKRQSVNASMFAPAVLGLLTILMPCGITQATMAVAVASGSPITGALIMFAFVLGTSPIFFVLGASFVELLKRKAFSVVAAVVVIIFAVISINGGMGLLGSIYTIHNFYKAATTDTNTLARGGVSAGVIGGVQNITIAVNNGGYTASATTLKVGVPVHITLTTNNTQGCIRAFTIPDLNLSKVLPVTGSESIDFTPQKIGRLAYSCSMGMYTGAFTIVQ
jgi:uncharacterized protein